ncbi:MAG: hypothetical protein BGP07_03120 [Rhizobiales bacterium 63-22]|nr:MAG: hypothetical protein BGP07_03120 [Rhizobiales bacterium 63-22]
MNQTRHAMRFIREQMKEREMQSDRTIAATRKKIRDEFRRALTRCWSDEKFYDLSAEAHHDN